MNNKNNKFTYSDIVLSEEDFYPPSDNRYLKSLVRDITGGDTFAEYAKYNFNLYESEDYYEN